METAEFAALGRKEIDELKDDDLKSQLFAPTARDYLVMGLIIVLLIYAVLVLKIILYSDIFNPPGLFHKYDSPETNTEFFIFGLAVLAFFGCIAILKLRYPFLFTKIGEHITVQSQGKRLYSVEIMGKCIKRKGRLLLRKFGDCVLITFFSEYTTYWNPAAFWRTNSSAQQHLPVHEFLPGKERIVMDRKQYEKFMDFIKGMENVHEGKEMQPRGAGFFEKPLRETSTLMEFGR